MIPVPQQGLADCTRAALASLLDMAYEEVTTALGTEDVEVYNRAVWEFLERHGLFRIDIPLDSLGKIFAWPGETHCLLTVKSKRFPEKLHHVVGRFGCKEFDGRYEWVAEVVHDPAERYYTEEMRSRPHEPISVDLVFRRL